MSQNFFERCTRAQLEAFGRINKYAQYVGPVGAVEDLPCPVCGTYMQIKLGTIGRYYQCPKRRCGKRVSAKPDGTPPKKYYDPLKVQLSKMEGILDAPDTRVR
jgi:hypothetical protein